MKSAPDPDGARGQIENALAVLRSTPSNDVRAVRQTFELVDGALEAARGALDQLDAQIEIATGPQRNLVRELIDMQKQLQAAQSRQHELEQQLALARADSAADRHMHDEEQRRLRELEKKTKGFEDLLLKDDDAFAKYFDRAIEQDEKKRGRKPPQR